MYIFILYSNRHQIYLNLTERKTIVITSLLKPVTDPRMYEKMARSISKNKKYDIHIFGQDIKGGILEKNITLHPHNCPPKLSFTRILLPFKIAFNIIKLKPEVVIVNSIDLLILIISNKILFGTKIIYDIRENYHFNLQFQSNYLGLKKRIFKGLIYTIERISGLFYDTFFLAEKSYFNELKFINKKKTTVLQNTCVTEGVTPTPFRNNNSYILYSGTIAVEYGIKELINWKTQSNHKNKLVIAGMCANPALKQWIRQKCNNRTDIELIGINHLVPHSRILELIQKASFAIMPYQKNQSIDRCIPTKLFEYISYQLPFLISKNLEWTQIMDEYHAGISVNFNDFQSIEKAFLEISQNYDTFFNTKGKTNTSWELVEQSLLLNSINSLIKK